MKSAAVLAVVLVMAPACATLRSSEPATDDRFGSRIEGTDPDGRETIVISPPEQGREWAAYPATFESVTVRPEPVQGQPVAVEILVKGAFPDACTELHAVTQERTGNIVDVTLDMRRERGAVCAAVLKPYRFYLMLDGRYAAGPYTLKLNGQAFPFEIRAPGS